MSTGDDDKEWNNNESDIYGIKKTIETTRIKRKIRISE